MEELRTLTVIILTFLTISNTLITAAIVVTTIMLVTTFSQSSL